MMDWFDEQLRNRSSNEEKVLSEAYESVIDSVMGERFSYEESENEIDSILKYYRLPGVKIPEEVIDENEKLRMVCRMSGLMQRSVVLDEGWHKDAFGAFLVRIKETGEFVAAIPDKMGRYCYYDRKKHKKTVIRKNNEDLLEREAICFYKPLPAKKLTIKELVKFGISSWSLTDYIFTYAVLGISTLVGLIIPELNYFLYSTVVESKSMYLLLSTVIFIVCVNICVLFLNAVKNLFTARTGVKMSAAIKSATMMRLLSLPSDFFRKYSSGEILSRMEYMESVCTGIVNMIFGTALSALFSLAYISQILKYTPSLVIPSLIIVLLNISIAAAATLAQVKISRIAIQKAAANTDILLHSVKGIQKIKTAGAEKRLFARYAKSFAEEIRMTYNPPLLIKINSVIALSVTLAGQLAMYGIAIKSGVSVAEYFAFQSAYGTVSAAIVSMAGIVLQAAALKPGLEMVKPILEELPETDNTMKEVTELSGNIEISNISFAYDESMPKVIDGFSLNIKKGEYIAIVGKTGCGKSTLVRLLLGFEKVHSGAIYYDGKDINRLEKRTLRQKIGTVMQNDKLFNGDIYSNIVICSPGLSLDRAWKAAEIAGIAEDIKDMPMGMHTVISEGNGGVSGGQKQRLTIARAVAPEPRILIFDEATSALDNITQKKVSEALKGLDCTRLVIAHRISTIQDCDRIIVMDKGKIAEEGTFQELVNRKGYFAELVERQMIHNVRNDADMDSFS